MNFVPNIPQMTQQTYGMNYGDWQQYAGFGKNKPFGGPGMPMDKSGEVKSPAALPPIDDTNPSQPVVPYTTKPIADFSQFGANPNNSYGANPNASMGAVQQDAQKSNLDWLNQHYD